MTGNAPLSFAGLGLGAGESHAARLLNDHNGKSVEVAVCRDDSGFCVKERWRNPQAVIVRTKVRPAASLDEALGWAEAVAGNLCSCGFRITHAVAAGAPVSLRYPFSDWRDREQMRALRAARA